MNERVVAALRLLVVALAGYFSLATSAPEEWFLRTAHVDLPLDTAPSVARIRVTLDAEAVSIRAPDVLGIQSSSGLVWMSGDARVEPEGYCTEHHGYGTFCEEVPDGSGAFEYELLLPSGDAGASTRVDVFAGAPPERLSDHFGVNIEVLP